MNVVKDIERVVDSDYRGSVFLIDAFEGIKSIPDCTLDAIITDPPYFFDGMGNTWDSSMTERKTTKKQTVQSLRSGMKFDKKQGVQFQEFMNKIAEEAYKKLKPGGWFVAFSAPRLYHRLAVGVEDAGYEIRDEWEWLYTQNQMKAMSISRQLEKDYISGNVSDDKYKEILEDLPFWKTPQVKSCFEPIVLAQKPRIGTFYENWKEYGTGLINVKSGQGENNDMATSNVMTTEFINEQVDSAFLVGKPTKKEKGTTTHLSVKPLSLMDQLTNVLVKNDGIILDPFNGSGTTGISSIRCGKRFIGFENNNEYFIQSMERNIKEFGENNVLDMVFENNRHYYIS